MAMKYHFNTPRKSAQDEDTENYRSAHNVPVQSLGKMTSGPHKGEVKLKTLRQVGSRPKGSIDYRQPANVHHS